MQAKKTKIGTIQAKVFRASTGTWENLGTIYSSKVSLIEKIINKIKDKIKIWQQ